MSKKISGITDHAILKYSERLLGPDVKLIKKQIYKSLPAKSLARLEDGKYKLREGGRAVVKNHRVVTILD